MPCASLPSTQQRACGRDQATVGIAVEQAESLALPTHTNRRPGPQEENKLKRNQLASFGEDGTLSGNPDLVYDDKVSAVGEF